MRVLQPDWQDSAGFGSGDKSGFGNKTSRTVELGVRAVKRVADYDQVLDFYRERKQVIKTAVKNPCVWGVNLQTKIQVGYYEF